MQRYCAGVIALVALVTVCFSVQARAVTVIDDPSTVPTTSVGAQIPSWIEPGSQVDYPIGSLGGVYRTPWEGTAGAGLQYTSVRGGTAGYNITGTGLQLFWGSPDTYNTLSFWSEVGGGGSLLFSITGGALSPPLGLEHHLVTILLGTTFRSITLFSGQPAFEFANLTATPIPGALPLFASVMGLLGLVRWVRRKVSGGQLAAA